MVVFSCEIVSFSSLNWMSFALDAKMCIRDRPSPAPLQEVVRLNFNSKAENSEPMLLCQPATVGPTSIADISVSIEISLGNATIRIAHGTDPAILDRCV